LSEAKKDFCRQRKEIGIKEMPDAAERPPPSPRFLLRLGTKLAPTLAYRLWDVPEASDF
jgi:hypothetical protein